jgi:hypothetical protein
MADNIRATPRNPVLGLFSDITQGGLDYLRDPRFRQSMMQLPAPVRPFGMGAVALPGLFESTGFPKTLERAAYGEPLTNISMANVPTLKPETADLMMNVAPFAPAALRGAAATGRFVAPKAGQLAEGYMQRMGMMPGIVPAEGGLLTPSVKPQAPVSDLGFYSAAEQAALNLQRNKGTGQSFINDLMKAPDVKKEELAWTGLDEFLANKPNVTKQEVQDYLAGNRVDLQEVRMGEAFTEDPVGVSKRLAIFDRYEPEIQALYKEMDNPRYKLVNRGMGAEEYNRGVVLQNRRFRGEPLTDQEQFQLDDILKRLDSNTVKEFANAEEARKVYTGMSQEEKLMHSIRPVKSSTQLREEINILQRNRDIEADKAYVIPEPIPTQYKKWQLPGGENYREILLTLPKQSLTTNDIATKLFGKEMRFLSESEKDAVVAEARKIENTTPKDYVSSHFEQPNILAHIRVNDRIDADGKKMLLIEELQSDWHQAGREKGYKTPQLEKALKEYETLVIRNANGQKLTPQEMARVKELQPLVSGKSGGVPDAPFKDTWHQLALKRALKYAVDNGYERVGLTTGAQQAKRYDLSKQVDEIAVPMVNADGSRSVRIEPTEGSNIKLMVDSNGVVTGYGSGSTQFSGKKLDEVLGKEIADKVMNAQASAKFSGLDLQVGGEGMKKYYDEIYPAFLSKQGKKFNAKTGETRIKTGQGIPGGAPVRYIDISPEMKGGVSKGQPMFAAAPIAGVGLGAGQQQQPADILTNELDYPSNPMYTDPLGYSIR